jgi:hypothetical protein
MNVRIASVSSIVQSIRGAQKQQRSNKSEDFSMFRRDHLYKHQRIKRFEVPGAQEAISGKKGDCYGLLRDGTFSQSTSAEVMRERSTNSARNVLLVVAVANARPFKAVPSIVRAEKGQKVDNTAARGDAFGRSSKAIATMTNQWPIGIMYKAQ